MYVDVALHRSDDDFYLDSQVWLKQACSSIWQRWLILEQQMEKSTRDYLTSSNHKQTVTKMYSASFHLSTTRIKVPYQKNSVNMTSTRNR